MHCTLLQIQMLFWFIVSTAAVVLLQLWLNVYFKCHKVCQQLFFKWIYIASCCRCSFRFLFSMSAVIFIRSCWISLGCTFHPFATLYFMWKMFLYSLPTEKVSDILWITQVNIFVSAEECFTYFWYSSAVTITITKSISGKIF